MLRGKTALIKNMKARSHGPDGQQLPCAYAHRACTHPRLDGYEFCLKHILEDKNSPYRQCSYQAPKTGRKCSNPAPKPDRADRKEGGRLCAEHSKQVIVAHMKANRRRRPKESAELLLDELTGSNEAAARRFADSVALKALEYGSSSDSDREELLVDQAFRPDHDSDAESIDSDQDDPLKHASVYSQEEAALLLRDKLIRLQALYIEQFKRLQHMLREKRRKYLQTVKQEREMLGPIQAYKLDPAQRKKYERLQALKRYHKFRGKEALLHQKCDKRRQAVAEGVNHRPPNFPRCHVPTPDGRCNQRVVPLSKMCFDHILKDPHQVLFEPCRFRQSQCSRPVINMDAARPPLCHRHFAASATASSSTHTQTEDIKVRTEPLEVKVEAGNRGQPSTSASHQLAGNISHPASASVGQELNNDALNNSDERLNSSGEGHLDLGVEELESIMESDELIEFVGDIFDGNGGF